MGYVCNFNINIQWLGKMKGINDDNGQKRYVNCFKIVPECNNRIIEVVFYASDDASYGTLEKKYSYLQDIL